MTITPISVTQTTTHIGNHVDMMSGLMTGIARRMMTTITPTSVIQTMMLTGNHGAMTDDQMIGTKRRNERLLRSCHCETLCSLHPFLLSTLSDAFLRRNSQGFALKVAEGHPTAHQRSHVVRDILHCLDSVYHHRDNDSSNCSYECGLGQIRFPEN